MTATDPYIRWMLRIDMPQVEAIERASFRVDAWTQDHFLAVLRKRNCIGMVAEGTLGEILGYLIYELDHTFLTVLNLAVRPDVRRKGIASAMLAKFRYKIGRHNRRHGFATVRDSNLPAQLLLRSQGFAAGLIARGHYPNGEDGIHFRYDNPDCGDPPAVTNRLSQTEDDE